MSSNSELTPPQSRGQIAERQEYGRSTWFTKNRNRLLEGDVAREFLCEVLAQAQARGLTSDGHFTVDGTLIEAWASLKSFQRKDQKEGPLPDDPGNPTVNFHGESRSNNTHQSSTDVDAVEVTMFVAQSVQIPGGRGRGHGGECLARSDFRHGSPGSSRHRESTKIMGEQVLAWIESRTI